MNIKQIIKQSIAIGVMSILTACGGGGEKSSNACKISKVKDSDGDGFYDVNDVEPHDAFKNGAFSTPEKIINNPEVKKVIKKAKEYGINIRTDVAHNPPNLTGYYKLEAGGRVVAAERTHARGIVYTSSERRLCMKKDQLEMKAVDFKEGKKGYTYKGIKIRGTGKYYTKYSLLSGTDKGCHTYYIDIESGKVDDSGNIVHIDKIIVPMTDGSCKSAWGWRVLNFIDFKKVTDLDELERMCVDGDKAYVPGETWKNKDKETCKCSVYAETTCE